MAKITWNICVLDPTSYEIPQSFICVEIFNSIRLDVSKSTTSRYSMTLTAAS